MNNATFYELLGYFASALVAVSLTMTSILRLRIINLIGAVLFTIYGLLINAYPVALVNFIIVLINLYQLSKLFRIHEDFRILDVSPDSAYLRQWLEFHAENIREFYPYFYEHPFDPTQPYLVMFVLRDMLPVGIFIGQETTDNTMIVKLDYVIQGYRDFKVGAFLYGQRMDVFKARGVQKIISYPGSSAHETYLKRMGFNWNFVLSDRRLYELKVA
jgi:hypothetical protein